MYEFFRFHTLEFLFLDCCYPYLSIQPSPRGPVLSYPAVGYGNQGGGKGRSPSPLYLQGRDDFWGDIGPCRQAQPCTLSPFPPWITLPSTQLPRLTISTLSPHTHFPLLPAPLWPTASPPPPVMVMFGLSNICITSPA